MTSDARQGRFDPRGDYGRVEQGHDLAILDPGFDDPVYWSRFRSGVVARAAGELARRRAAAEVGVADFLQSWARTVIRTAAIAAAIAGVLLMRDRPAPAWGVEDALTRGLEDRTLPDLMERPEGGDPFLLVDVTF
jgi:hypothetical protein